MRAALLPFLLLTACAEPSVAPISDPEAFELLSHVDRSALTDVFARALEDGYTADVVVTTFEGGVARRDSSVISPGDSATRLRLRDPIDQALSDDPPYLDPSVREAYTSSVLGDTTIDGARFQRVEAVLADTTRELGLRRVWAAIDDQGRVGALEVERRSDSAIFVEQSVVRVEVAPGSRRPRRVVTDTQTDVPLSAPRRVRIEWTVR